MIFTGVRDVQTDDVTGIQLLVSDGNQTWKGKLMRPIAFIELMLSSHVLPPIHTDGLFKRIHEQGRIVEENVAVSDEQLEFLRLHRMEALQA
jgi:hypothetical protein